MNTAKPGRANSHALVTVSTVSTVTAWSRWSQSVGQTFSPQCDDNV